MGNGGRIRGRTETLEEELEQIDPLRPSAWRTLREAFSLSYDYLGYTLAGSLVAFAVGVAIWLLLPRIPSPSPLFYAFRSGLAVVLLYAFLAGPAQLALQVSQREDPSLKDLLQGWRHGFGRALLLGLLNGGAATVLLGDLLFFLGHPSPYFKLAAVPCAYLSLLWLCAQTYGLPLLLLGLSPARAFRQMFLLALANPVFTGVLSFVIIALTMASLATWAPMMLFTPMLVLVIGMCATQALLRKYDVLEDLKRK